MADSNDQVTRVGRRAFLRGGTLVLLASVLDWSSAGKLFGDEAARPAVRLGLVTDLHYADKPQKGTRYYRETLAKLAEAAEQFKKDKPEIVVSLGDIIDDAETLDGEKAHLKTVVEA